MDRHLGLASSRSRLQQVGVGVAGQQRGLEEDHRGVPHRRRSAQHRQDQLGHHRLDQEDQRRRGEDGHGEQDRRQPVAARRASMAVSPVVSVMPAPYAGASSTDGRSGPPWTDSRRLRKAPPMFPDDIRRTGPAGRRRRRRARPDDRHGRKLHRRSGRGRADGRRRLVGGRSTGASSPTATPPRPRCWASPPT